MASMRRPVVNGVGTESWLAAAAVCMAWKSTLAQTVAAPTARTEASGESSFVNGTTIHLMRDNSFPGIMILASIACCAAACVGLAALIIWVIVLLRQEKKNGRRWHPHPPPRSGQLLLQSSPVPSEDGYVAPISPQPASLFSIQSSGTKVPGALHTCLPSTNHSYIMVEAEGTQGTPVSSKSGGSYSNISIFSLIPQDLGSGENGYMPMKKYPSILNQLQNENFARSHSENIFIYNQHQKTDEKEVISPSIAGNISDISEYVSADRTENCTTTFGVQPQMSQTQTADSVKERLNILQTNKFSSDMNELSANNSIGNIQNRLLPPPPSPSQHLL